MFLGLHSHGAWGTRSLRDEVHEAGQRLVGLVPHVTELHHHLLFQLVVDDGDGERRRLVGQEAPIVGALQVKLEICPIQKTTCVDPGASVRRHLARTLV